MHCFTKDYDHYSQADRAKLMYKTSLEERPFVKYGMNYLKITRDNIKPSI